MEGDLREVTKVPNRRVQPAGVPGSGQRLRHDAALASVVGAVESVSQNTVIDVAHTLPSVL